MVGAAEKAPKSVFVLVIEEINRGSPAQIFGEMLTLLEGSKRTPDEALELAYSRFKGERMWIPGTLHVIGTMNIADRSLALVDLALRRRFAFIDLEPQLGPAWRAWVTQQCGIDDEFARDIEKRLNQLNATIAADTTLGRQFRVGHSYVTPTQMLAPGTARTWFKQTVATEIRPLLDEYWFDALEKATEARRVLTDGL
jgi:5-methylcytosine-specific restriction protein B